MREIWILGFCLRNFAPEIDITSTMYKFFIFLFFCSFALNAYSQIEATPFLLYPQNGQTVEETAPTFSWTQASENYHILRIVELLEGQSPEEGFLSNPSFFYMEGIRFSSLSYPLGAKPFNKGKKYAWAVLGSKKSGKLSTTSKVGMSEVVATQTQFDENGWSEVYVFQYKDESVESVCLAGLSQHITENFYVLKNQQITFSFSNAPELEGKDCVYRFLTEDKKDIKDIQRKIIPIFADNVSGTIELRQYQFFREKNNLGKIFLLEAKSEDGHAYYIKFKNN